MYLEFFLEYSSHTESLCITLNPDSGLVKHQGASLGTWFTEIINMNYSEVSQIVDEYFSAYDKKTKEQCLGDIFYDRTNPDIVSPPNCMEVYNKLIQAFPIIGIFYHMDSWVEIVYDFYNDEQDTCCNVCGDVEEFKKFLNVLINNPTLFNYDFLETLNRQDKIPPIGVTIPSLEYKDNLKFDSLNSDTNLEQFLLSAYKHFSDTQIKSLSKVYIYRTNKLSRFSAVLISSLLELTRNGKIVKKCSNCGKYFIPKNRSDTLYCDAASPQDQTLTCMQYGSQRLWYERQKGNELATLSRKIASAKGMLAKRNPDIPEYTASYEYFKAERLIWKKAVDDERKTKEEYREWLLSMQSQKIIKEATNGTHRKE